MTNTDNSTFANPFNQHHNRMAGMFTKNSSASLPQGMSYEEALARQAELHVPGAAIGPEMTINLDMRSYGETWNNAEIYSRPDIRSAVGMSREDIAHEEFLKHQAAEMSANMTDEQKELLAHIEDFIGKSNLIDESIQLSSEKGKI